MMRAERELRERLNRIAAGAPENALYLMVLEAMAMARDLPPALRSGLAVAVQRWYAGVQDVPPLEPFRVACWEHLDRTNLNTTTIADREDMAVRALICLLYEDFEDLGMTMDFFASMVGGYWEIAAEQREEIEE